MSEHLTETFSEKLAKNQKIVFSEQKFNTKRNITGRLWYFWSMTVVAFFVFVVAPPILLILGLIRRREWFYPFAQWGARTWLKLSGVRIVTKGLENLEPGKAYVFAS